MPTEGIASVNPDGTLPFECVLTREEFKGFRSFDPAITDWILDLFDDCQSRYPGQDVFFTGFDDSDNPTFAMFEPGTLRLVS